LCIHELLDAESYQPSPMRNALECAYTKLNDGRNEQINRADELQSTR